MQAFRATRLALRVSRPSPVLTSAPCRHRLSASPLISQTPWTYSCTPAHRTFKHLAQHYAKLVQKSHGSDSKMSTKTGADLVPDEHVSRKEQRRRDRLIIRRLSVNLWPEGDWGTKSRVIIGVGLLVAGKVHSADL